MQKWVDEFNLWMACDGADEIFNERNRELDIRELCGNSQPLKSSRRRRNRQVKKMNASKRVQTKSSKTNNVSNA